MKPILFPEGQKDFSTNGLGRLPDAISCKVTEERNGQYELHMEYRLDNIINAVEAFREVILDTRIIPDNSQRFSCPPFIVRWE